MHWGPWAGMIDVINAASMVSRVGLGRGWTAEILDSGLSPALEGLRAIPVRPRAGGTDGCGDVRGVEELGDWMWGEAGKGWTRPGFWLQAPAPERSLSWRLECGQRSWTKSVPIDLQVTLVNPRGR